MALCRRSVLYQSPHFQGFPFNLPDRLPWPEDADRLGLEHMEATMAAVGPRKRRNG